MSDFSGFRDMTGKVRAAALAARATGERLVRASFVAWGILLSAVVVVGPAVPSAIAADAEPSAHATPEQVVAGFHAALLHAMHDAAYQTRFDALAPAMNRAFDFETMTRIAIGPSWYNLRRDQQDALINAFRRFSIANYASQFDQYSGERFEAAGQSQPAPQGIIVVTVMQPAQGDAIKFSYLLHRTAGGWRIIDIYLDGTISQLAVRRSEFASVLAQSGADGLTQMLDQKTRRLAMM